MLGFANHVDSSLIKVAAPPPPDAAVGWFILASASSFATTRRNRVETVDCSIDQIDAAQHSSALSLSPVLHLLFFLLSCDYYLNLLLLFLRLTAAGIIRGRQAPLEAARLV